MLKNLPNLLRAREAALDERERELERLRASLEKEHPNHGAPSDVMRLNIGGGARVDVLRRTLTQFEGSLLESKFSGRWDESLEKDADGNFFIDQPERLFVPLIDYFRSKQCETPLAVVTEPPEFDKKKDEIGFNRMVEYYGLTLAVYPIGMYRLTVNSKVSPDNWEQMDEVQCKIESNEWATYCLKRSTPHSRFVISYEVTLEQYSVAQIGWIQTGPSCVPEYFKSETDRGVGYGNHSLSLDCIKSSIALSGAITAIEGMTVTDGTTIRSEHGGRRWFVNGKVVAQCKKEEDEGVYFKGGLNASDEWVPCISIKGSCKISVLELSN